MNSKGKRFFFGMILIAIPVLIAGWFLFSRYIRPYHYQLLRPYTIAGGKRLVTTESRTGADGALQVYIPEGPAVLGKESWETTADVPAYWIRQIPVTLGEFKTYARESGELGPHYRNEYLAEYDGWWNDLKPVVFVGWDQAEAYCEYYGGHLPTEAQWEKAARGTDGTVLCWDDDEKAYDRANYGNFYSGKTPAGWLPGGVSSYGLLDMSGNVREWVLDPMMAEDQPIHTDSWQEILQLPVGELGRILKGGGFSDDLAHLRLNWRDAHDPTSPGLIRGFRCAFEAE